jgi:hypothetical protein
MKTVTIILMDAKMAQIFKITKNSHATKALCADSGA